MASVKIKELNFSYQYFSSVTGGLFKSNAGLKTNTALSDINLELNDGDRVALLGRNGAGKSTLLKLISGVITPQAGSLTTVGKIYSFFGRNVGVMPQLSGLENLKVRGLLLNLSDELIDQKILKICEFIELGDDIHRPVSSYSQGMKARLTFGMMMFVDAEILLIDEGLAAGDRFFIQKAHHFINDLLGKSKVMVFASHSDQLLKKFCNKALYLEKGRIKAFGDFTKIKKQYEQSEQ